MYGAEEFEENQAAGTANTISLFQNIQLAQLS